METRNQGYKVEITIATYWHFHVVGLYLEKLIIEFDSMFTKFVEFGVCELIELQKMDYDVVCGPYFQFYM